MKTTSCFTMRFALILMFCCLFYPMSSWAQLKIQFTKGKIVLKNGTSVTGWIREDAMKEMNVRIYYSEKENNKELIRYDTSQVVSVYLENGDAYRRVTYEDPITKKTIPVLARVLVDGNAETVNSQSINQQVNKSTSASASLLFFRSQKREYFMITNNGKQFLLIKDAIEGKELMKHYFKNVVAIAFGDKPALQPQIDKLRYDQTAFIKITVAYNDASLRHYTVTRVKTPQPSYLIAYAAAGSTSSRTEEMFQLNYRMYFPRISKATSLNVGVNYFNFKHYGSYSYVFSGVIITNGTGNTRTRGHIISLPVQVQQNILNGPVRPYLFIGITFSYISDHDDKGRSLYTGDYPFGALGADLLFGGGIEWSIVKGLMLKAEYRHEGYQEPVHPLFFGLGYALGIRGKRR